MVNTADVQRYADVIMAMIKQDQDSGQVPREVSSWDELDDSVDTDDYYRQALLPVGTRAATDLHDAVNHEVTRRLAGAQGGPWMVTWTPAGRPAMDIGRAIGYATQAEAEEIGREYLARHGGTYHVHVG